MNKIQKLHTGEDYTLYSYVEDGETQEVEIQGIAQKMINTLLILVNIQYIEEMLREIL